MWSVGTGPKPSQNIFSPTCIQSQFGNEFEGNDQINVLLSQQHFQLLQPLIHVKFKSKCKTVTNIDSNWKNEIPCPSTSADKHFCKGKNVRNNNLTEQNHILASSTSTCLNTPQSVSESFT